MDETNAMNFVLEISSSDATVGELDELTRQLLRELQQTEVESVEMMRGELAPAGAKGDPVTTGAIAIAVLPAVLPKIVETIQGWVLRGSNRTVKFKGKGIEFEGSPDELNKLLDKLDKGRKKK